MQTIGALIQSGQLHSGEIPQFTNGTKAKQKTCSWILNRDVPATVIEYFAQPSCEFGLFVGDKFFLIKKISPWVMSCSRIVASSQYGP